MLTFLMIGTHRWMALLSLAALVLKSLIFEPIDLWPVAFACMVPWLVMVGGSAHAPRVYFHSYLLGLGFFFLSVRWMYVATGWGYLALVVYLAAYFPLTAIPVRHAVRRRHWPLAIVFPIVWTGSEMLRAVVFTGFPWFYLGHSLHGVLTLIQISDLVGAYGVSFLVAALNGAIADAVFARAAGRFPDRVRIGVRRIGSSAVFAGCIALVVVVYGIIQLQRDTITSGPRIAVIQGDFINSIYPKLLKDHDRLSEGEKMGMYLSMMQSAASEKPDLYLLPESPWGMLLNPEAREFNRFYRRSFAELREHAMKHDAVVVTGSGTAISTPNDLVATERKYNSAMMFTPDGAEPQRYDKVHVVPFGETLPFREGRFRFLYFWINRIMPFSGKDGQYEYSIFPGREFRRFTMESPSQGGKSYRFSIPICYEDVMPYVSRRFVCGGSDRKQVDFLLNISNDGWFGRGVQQPQHLAICVFRAVENRVGIARAVNTGVSGFIRPDGRVHDVVDGDPLKRWPGACGYALANIGVDSRLTFYSRYGDWFAWSCAVLWLALFIDYWVARARGMGEE